MRAVVRRLVVGVGESGVVTVHGWPPVWFEFREPACHEYRPGAPLAVDESAVWQELTRALGPSEF